ncbi:MAG: LytR C-terminal domain-containing protein [Actinobacteria bacterium]|nr:LytR C-terminal domain-containing protein [Actinomycetota bacterium]
MELVRPLQLVRDHAPLDRSTLDRSALASARLHRRLTVDEAAKRADLTAEQVEWLEEGRVYRFPSADHALEAAVLLTAALEIDRREARELAGLPVPPRPLDVNPTGRLVVVAALSAAVMALVAFVLVPVVSPKSEPPLDPVLAQAASLPKPWEIQVHVLNGGGDINWTRQIASRIQSLAYTVKAVRRADRFDYLRTAVYYPPGSRLIAVRLARQLGVVTLPLPGGTDAKRLVVIVGPQRGPS